MNPGEFLFSREPVSLTPRSAARRKATEADAAPGGAVDKPTELELALRGEGKKRTVKPKPADDVPATDKSEEVWL